MAGLHGKQQEEKLRPEKEWGAEGKIASEAFPEFHRKEWINRDKGSGLESLSNYVGIRMSPLVVWRLAFRMGH